MCEKIFFAAILSFLFISCAQSQEKTEPNAGPPVESKAVAQPEPPPVTEPVVVAAKVTKEIPPKPVGEEIWKVKNGKIVGHWPKMLLISKFKNKKLPGFTSDFCFNYGDFSIVETKSTGEMGSAEIVIRHEPKGLCLPEYKGKYSNLRIMEGHFGGVAGDYVLVDGDDKTEGVVDFQLFALADGKEAFKGRRNPDAEFNITRENGVTAVTFFTKMKVLCELAADGQACWKKVLEQNDAPKGLPMPDCKTAFEKAKVALTEPVLVTAKARVRNLNSGKVEFIPGKATCVPEPN